MVNEDEETKYEFTCNTCSRQVKTEMDLLEHRLTCAEVERKKDIINLETSSTLQNVSHIIDTSIYLKVARMVLFSKTGRAEVQLNDIRPIAIMSHLTKIIEKAIKNKLEELDSKLLQAKDY